MATIVNMHEAKSSLSRLVRRAAEGEEILIASHGKPVAKLTPIQEKRTEVPWDIFKGRLVMTDDFDAPLEEMKDYL